MAIGAAVLVLALLYIVAALVAGRIRLAELVGAECVLDGKMLSTLPRGIDVTVTPEALTAVGSGDSLRPNVLLQTGVAKQVLFEGRLYWLNGPYLASRLSDAQKLPSSWLISVGGSRKVSWRKTATRVTVSDPGGHEVGFVEYLRGCIGKPGKPLGIIQALGIREDGPSLPDEVDPAHPRRFVAVTWQPLPKQDSGSVARPSSSGCPASVQYHKDWSMHIRFKHSELHPRVRPFLVCKGNTLYVLQHEARHMYTKQNFLLLNRFDIRREAWLDATKFEGPPGLLSDVSIKPNSTAIQITLGSRRMGGQQTARLELAAVDQAAADATQ
ncbi:MAG: hypothetical protein WKG03_16955 [Telluria sp.]